MSTPYHDPNNPNNGLNPNNPNSPYGNHPPQNGPGYPPTPPQKERPVVITVFCVLGFIGAAVVFPFMLTDLYAKVAHKIGEWYTPFLLLSSVVGLICMIGLWMMKKWAVYLYTGMTILGQIVIITWGDWTPLGIIMPGIVIAVGFNHIDKMD
ncbi:MAG TPA: hypothetical protein VK826_06195 [Bacteroidia bacterium]|nr:hypothetical protein [Bacteroidia bacterium]